METPESVFPELAEIYRATNRHAPTLKAQMQNIAESQGNAMVLSSDKYPDFRVLLDGVYTRRNREDEDVTNTVRLNYNLSLVKPIYQWGAIKARDRIGEHNVKLAKTQYRLFYLSLIAKVRNLYLDLVMKKLFLRNNLLEEQIVRRRIEDQKERQKLGTVSEDAYTLSLISLQETLLNIEKSRRAIDRAKDEFIYLTGFEALNLEEIPTQIPPLTYSIEKTGGLLKEYLEDGMEKRADWVMKVEEINRARENLTIARSRNRPMVEMVASATQDERDTATRNDVATLIFFGGVQVRWNIFDGLANKGRAMARIAQLRLLELQLNDLRVNRKREAEKTASDLNLEYRYLKLKEERFEVDKKVWERNIQDWENEILSDLEHLQGQLNYFRKEYGLLLARSKFLLSLSNYLSLLGEDPALNYFTAPETP